MQPRKGALDDKDKIIAVLAIGFCLMTVLVSIQLVALFQRYGVSPAVSLTEFSVADPLLCDGQVDVSYSLTNTGRAGFAQVEIVADGVVVWRNSYHLAQGETRPILVPLYLDDCVARSYGAQVTSTWT